MNSAGLATAAAAVLTWTAAALFEGCLWPLPRADRLALGTLCIAMLAAVVAAGVSRYWAPRRSAFWLVPASLAVLMPAAVPHGEFAGLALALACLGRLTARSQDAAGRAAAATLDGHALGIALFGLLAAGRTQPAVSRTFQAASDGVSSLVAAATGIEVHFGPTALGLDGAALTFALVAGRVLVGPSRRAFGWLSASVVVLAGAVLAHAWLLTRRAEAQRPFTMEAFEEGPIWFTGLWWLWGGMLLCLLVATAALGGTTPAATVRPRPYGRALLAGALGCAAGLTALQLPPRPWSEARLLLVCDADDQRLRPPTSPHSGYHEQDGFALLPRLLAAHGIAVTESAGRPLDEELLAAHDAVLFVHPDLPSARDLALLDGFVRKRGGGLVLVGDHTPPRDSLDRLAAVLQPLGIDYRFDSAYIHAPMRELSRSDRSALGTALAECLQDTYGVGASLALSGSARALVDARWAVGDRGYETTPSLLGNRHYENGDALGDRVVVAAAQWGTGTVVVVADTGILLDSGLPYSYPFALRLVETAIGGVGGPPTWLRSLSLLIAALAAALLAGQAALGPLTAATAAAGLALGGCVSAALARPLPRPNDSEPLAVLDFSHRPRTASTDRLTDRSVKGLANQAFRCGLLPLVTFDPDLVGATRPELVVVIAPTQRLSAERVQRLLTWVDAGTTLVLACGFEERRGSANLLAALGVEVTSRLVGAERHRRTSRGDEREEAALVHYRESWGIMVRNGAAHAVLFERDAVPVAVELRRGRGRAIVVGDSWFFADDNLQSARTALPANVALAHRIVTGR